MNENKKNAFDWNRIKILNSEPMNECLTFHGTYGWSMVSIIGRAYIETMLNHSYRNLPGNISKLLVFIHHTYGNV